MPPLSERRILLDNFIKLHDPSFLSAAQAAVEMHGGASTFNYSKFCLVFNLQYVQECEGNPARAFTINHRSFVRIDDLQASSLYAEALDIQRTALERARDITMAEAGNVMEGQLLTCFEADPWMLWSGFSICCLSETTLTKIRIDNTGASSWLDELKSFTGRGHVLREIQGEVRNLMQVGSMTMKNSGWKFRPLTDGELKHFGYNKYAEYTP